MKEHTVRSLLAEPTSSKPCVRPTATRLAPCWSPQHVCCQGCLAIGSWLPTALQQRGSEGPGCFASQERTPPVHPRLTSPGSQRFRDGAGLGHGELTDERLRFHRKTSTDPTPATCNLRAGPRFARSRRIQSRPIRVVRSGDTRVVSTASGAPRKKGQPFSDDFNPSLVLTACAATTSRSRTKMFFETLAQPHGTPERLLTPERNHASPTLLPSNNLHGDGQGSRVDGHTGKSGKIGEEEGRRSDSPHCEMFLR